MDLNDFDMLSRYFRQTSMDENADDDAEVNISVSEEMRRLYVELYRAVICGDKEKLKNHQNHLNKPIVIECLRGCSCARQFEQHPHRPDDMQGGRLGQILDLVQTGKCQCLVDHDTPVTRQVVKYLSHIVTSMGDLQLLKFLVQHGCTVDKKTTTCRYTPLFIAVMKNDINLVRYFLTLGVNINHRSKMEKHTPLMEALLDNKVTIVNMLLSVPHIDVNMPNFRNETPLIIAARMEHAEFVTQLLQSGANPNAKDIRGITALMHAIRLGFADIAKILLSNGAEVDVTDCRSETALQFAVYREDVDLVSMLLEAGANPNHIPDDGFPALVVAAYSNSWEIINLLLEKGAKISSTNNHHYSAIHIASWNGHVESVETLLKHSAPHDTKTADKNTPLSLAAHGKHPQVIELLLPYGCDVDNSDKDLDTPLHYASYNGDVESVKLLLKHGADPDAKNRVYVTPLWNAVYCKNTAVIKLLLEKNVDLCVPSVGVNQHYQSDVVTYIYETPRTPLWVAAARNAPEAAMLLISAGYDVAKEEWILDDMPEAAADNEPFSSLLRYYKCTPVRLLSLCRNFFRQHFGKNVAEKTQALEIPQVLKHHIMLKDILG